MDRETNGSTTDPKNVVTDGKTHEVSRARGVRRKLLGDDGNIRKLTEVSRTRGITRQKVKGVRVKVNTRLGSGD